MQCKLQDEDKEFSLGFVCSTLKENQQTVNTADNPLFSFTCMGRRSLCGFAFGFYFLLPLVFRVFEDCLSSSLF